TNSLTSFRSGGNILATYIGGDCVARNGVSLQQKADIIPVNKFDCPPRSPQDFRIPAQGTQIRVIEVIDKQLITNGLTVAAAIHNGDYVTDVGRDILKIAVVNRYADAPVAVGFITAFGLKRGAIASSVAHDSHNIVAVGTNDNDLCNAVNAIIHHKGGVSISNGNNTRIVPLDIAGLMSSMDGYTVAARYAELDTKARALGSRLTSPFMSLSFMALLVIPALKMSDKGLFDCTSFGFTTLAAP
ncbi:MAG: adenine deaminase, partial [Candidatus Kapabacteria bacterium]|nr:adenine deaminase [Candidatus Kapabacteria bacterium]